MSKELTDRLKSLNLPIKDYAVFGSGPMYAHGIKDMSHDLDIVSRGEAWKIVSNIQEPVVTKSGINQVVSLFNDSIEIFNGWGPGEWNVDELIDSAEIFDGIPYVSLSNVLKWKKIMNREKDAEHIRLIEEYLAKNL